MLAWCATHVCDRCVKAVAHSFHPSTRCVHCWKYCRVCGSGGRSAISVTASHDTRRCEAVPDRPRSTHQLTLVGGAVRKNTLHCVLVNPLPRDALRLVHPERTQDTDLQLACTSTECDACLTTVRGTVNVMSMRARAVGS